MNGHVLSCKGARLAEVMKQERHLETLQWLVDRGQSCHDEVFTDPEKWTKHYCAKQMGQKKCPLYDQKWVEVSRMNHLQTVHGIVIGVTERVAMVPGM